MSIKVLFINDHIWLINEEFPVGKKLAIYEELFLYICIILFQYNYQSHVFVPQCEWFSVVLVRVQSTSKLMYFEFLFFCTLAPPICAVIGQKFSRKRGDSSLCFACDTPANSGLTLSQSMIESVKPGFSATWSEITA